MRNEINFALLVNDYDKAIRWYCSTLGLFCVETDTDWGAGNRFVYLVFTDPMIPFGISLTVAQRSEDLALVGRQAGDNILLVFPVSDCMEMHKMLVQRGAEIEKDVIELPYGKQLVCRDCFGNRISLFQRYPPNE